MLSKYDGGVDYKATVTFKMSPDEKVQMMFRNDNTDGKFVTQSEYDRLIRRKKLKKIIK